MPVNVRLLRQPACVPVATLKLRPLLAIGGITRNASGAVIGQSSVRPFAKPNDVLASRDTSDPGTGVYTVSVFDAAAYYVVGIQDGSFDSTVVTWDNTTATFDRTQSVGGVTGNNLQGAS